MAETHIVAIINITPDSFSDGGEYNAPERAVAAIRQAMDDGADIIDIGAESTRPGALPVTAEEEWERLQPVLSGMPQYLRGGISISIDTRHPATAAQALGYGIDWINDVSGFAAPAMVEAVKDSGCKLVVMHSLSVPADTTLTLPEEVDIIEQLIEFAHRRFAALETAGIRRERMIFDPGVGFGKTAAQSWEILKRAGELKELGVPVFIGHSRKSFLMMQAATKEEKDKATLDISRTLTAQGIDYLRVHNVSLHRRMLKDLQYVA